MIQRGECQLEALTEPELQAAGKTASEQNSTDRAMRERFEAMFNETKPHVVIFSRYGGPLASQMLKIVRQAGVPIIAHFDDDLLGVPPDLGPDKYRRYNDPMRLAAIHTVLQESDVVYTSTSALAERLQERGISVPIVAGSIYCSGESLKNTFRTQPPIIGYMGTGGHAHDLAIALPGLIRLLDVRSDIRFELFGTIPMPDSMHRFGARVVHHPFNSNYNAFLHHLGKLGWSIGLAPLTDIPFNTVKANTKWVEYTSAGIAVIASDHPVYRESCAMGCGLVVNGDGWFEAISSLVDNPAGMVEMSMRARNKLEGEFHPERLRSQLLSVFKRAGAMLPATDPRDPEPKLP
jgi:glycosyltransferase involved in cell wall biosynthesis